MVVHVPKRHSGEHFSDLGMITRLLSSKPQQRSSLAGAGAMPLIEVMTPGQRSKDAVSQGRGVEGEEEEEEEEEEEFDWQVDQQMPDEEEEVCSCVCMRAYECECVHACIRVYVQACISVCKSKCMRVYVRMYAMYLRAGEEGLNQFASSDAEVLASWSTRVRIYAAAQRSIQ